MRLGQRAQRAPSWLRFAVKTKSGGFRSREPVHGRISLLRVVGVIVLLCLFASVLWWWYAAYMRLATLRGPVTELASVTVDIPASGTVIGRAELGQPEGSESAESEQLEFFTARVTDNQTGIFVRNRAHHRRALVRFADQGRAYLEWWWLRPNGEHTVTLPGATFLFSAIGSDRFDLTVREDGRPVRERRYHVQVGTFGVDMTRTDPGAPVDRPACRGVSLRSLRSAIGFAAQKYVPALAAAELRIVDLVGAADCFDAVTPQIGAKLATAREAWRELVIFQKDGRFYLVPGEGHRGLAATFAFNASPNPRERAPVKDVMASATGFTGPAGIAWRVDGPNGIRSITAGRTRYQVIINATANPPSVTLTPVSTVALFDTKACREQAPEAHCPTPVDRKEIKQQWRGDFQILARTGARVLDPGEAARAETWLDPREIQLRVLAAIVAIAVVLLSTGLRSRIVTVLLRRRYRSATPVSASDSSPAFAILMTVAAIALLLAPDVSVFVHRPISAEWSFRLILAAWALAGIAMVRSGAPLALLSLWIAFTALAAIGTTTLLTMAVDGNTTHWAIYGVKHEYLFLALVPPFAIIAATVPLGRVRTLIQESLVSVRPGYRSMRWLAVGLLIVPFGAWMLAGAQQGIGGFQPVEAGKFAAAVIVATLFAGLGAATRRTAMESGTGAKVVSFALLCGLLGVLMVVPVFRNDYSPALIVGLLVAALFGAWLLPTSIAGAREAIARHVAYRRIPLAFWPRRTRRWVLAAVIVGILAVPVGLLLLPLVMSTALPMALGINGWPDDRQERMEVLQKGYGYGRSIPVERFLIYEDLHLDTVSDLPADCLRGSTAASTREPLHSSVDKKDCPRAHFRDLEFQVIRARAAVGHAECKLTGPLATSFDALPKTMRTILEAPVRFFDDAIIFGVVNYGLCPPVFDLARAENSSPEKPPRQGLLDDNPPIGIPVVQNDFAAAYLIARFGVVAGLLFAIAQAGVIVLGLITFSRLLLQRNETRPGDIGVRTFLLITTAGAILLFVLHWTISWSNVLGLLPLMGQPMSWLSAATSHHLFMVLPCLMIMIISGRYVNFRPVRIRWHAPPRR